MSLNFQPQDNMNVHFQFMTVEIIVAFGYFMITLLQFVLFSPVFGGSFVYISVNNYNGISRPLFRVPKMIKLTKYLILVCLFIYLSHDKCLYKSLISLKELKWIFHFPN